MFSPPPLVPRPRLQYRMHPTIREFPSTNFYGGHLKDGPSVEQVSDDSKQMVNVPYSQQRVRATRF